MAVEVHRRDELHHGRVFTLVQETVTLENGKTTTLDLVQHPGAAAMVPLIGAGELLLLRQYRHAVGGTLWEIPAGTLDPGESPQACAERELVEETGHRAARWRKLGEIVPVPGYSTERIHIFLAEGLSPAAQALDEDEVIAVERVSLSGALAMIARGEIQDAKTICGLHLAAAHLSGAVGD